MASTDTLKRTPCDGEDYVPDEIAEREYLPPGCMWCTKYSFQRGECEWEAQKLNSPPAPEVHIQPELEPFDMVKYAESLVGPWGL